MRKTNISFLMKMTDDFLNGELDIISYWLDFPYEVEKRYKKLVREDRELAEVIYDYLVEDGVNHYDELTERDFRALIKKQSRNVNEIILELYGKNFDEL